MSVHRKAEDMNHHSICLHVLADSFEYICVYVLVLPWLLLDAVFMLVLPLFKSHLDQGVKIINFNLLDRGYLSIRMKNGGDDRLVLEYVRAWNCKRIWEYIQDLTIQTEES